MKTKVKKPKKEKPVEVVDEFALEKKRETKLTVKQEAFCNWFVHPDVFYNATKAYMKAYGVKYDVAKSNGSRMLANANVNARINEHLALLGWSDAFVDAQHMALIQQNVNANVKIRAIEHYDKKMGRIIDRSVVKQETSLTGDEDLDKFFESMPESPKNKKEEQAFEDALDDHDEADA